MNRRGFTVIELTTIITLLLFVGIIFWTQKNNIQIAARDDQRKTAINSMYYTLEEVYYPANKAYPKTLDKESLPSVDPALMKDPNGILIGKADSDYRYEPTNCINDSCKGYSLRTTMESEAEFVRTSRNN